MDDGILRLGMSFENNLKRPDFDIAVEGSMYSMYNDTKYPLMYNKIL